MSKLQVAVLMGGPSLEHDVSLVSGTGIVRALDFNKYDVFPVLITRAGLWVWRNTPLQDSEKQDFSPDDFLDYADLIKSDFPDMNRFPARDLAFLGLHGSFGEDGRVQALFELAGIPYTGSGILGSALALDKIQAKKVYEASGINTPRWAMITKADFQSHGIADLQARLPFPWFCKDPVGGSSIAMGKAEDELAAQKLLHELFAKTNQLLVESCVVGTEVSCGFIENCAPCPATEIRVASDTFFDFEAKYKGKSQEITPAEIPAERMVQVQRLAADCHRALGLDVYSRTDMILTEDEIFVLETNTLPGFTPSSLLPQQAAVLGYSYSALLDLVIQNSLEVRA